MFKLSLLVLFSFSVLAQDKPLEYTSSEEIQNMKGMSKEMYDQMRNIFGKDDRSPLSKQSEFAKSVGLLVTNIPTEHGMMTSECTATIIYSKFLITAAHCVFDDFSRGVITDKFLKFYPSLNLFNYENDLLKIKSDGVHISSKYMEDKKRCYEELDISRENLSCSSWSSHDWAILELGEEIDQSKYHSLELLETSVLNDISLSQIIGYPFDLQILKEVKTNRDDGGILIKNENFAPAQFVNSKVLIDYPNSSEILTYADFAVGMSGGPFIAKGKVLGVVSALLKEDRGDLGQTGLNKGTLLTPIVKSEICHWATVNGSVGYLEKLCL